MSKTRWIIPVQETGRIEITVNTVGQCKIELFDSKNEKMGDKGTLDDGELAQLIEKLLIARSTMRGEESEVTGNWCCDPGNGSRPVPGCQCFCCRQARAIIRLDEPFTKIQRPDLLPPVPACQCNWCKRLRESQRVELTTDTDPGAEERDADHPMNVHRKQ